MEEEEGQDRGSIEIPSHPQRNLPLFSSSSSSHPPKGRDIIGLAETGSGKTAAFALPVLQALLHAEGKKALFCCVLAPAR